MTDQLPREIYERIVKADIANLAARVKAGKPLTAGQLRRLEDAVGETLLSWDEMIDILGRVQGMVCRKCAKLIENMRLEMPAERE